MPGNGGDDLIDEQLRYYSARAPTYDDAYARTGVHDHGPESNAAWFAEMGEVESALAAAELTGDVLELGCGTGHWTELLARTATHVTALDASAEMLAIAPQRANVTYELVDVIRDWTPARRYDAVTAFFFLEHVPDEHLPSVVDKIAASLVPAGKVFVAEGQHREEHHEAAPVEHRHLEAHQFRVVERRRTEADFVAAFAAAGITVEYSATPRLFCIVQS